MKKLLGITIGISIGYYIANNIEKLINHPDFLKNWR